MIISHVADTHLSESRGDSGESLNEIIDRLIWCGEDARQADVEFMLVAGDVFNQASSPAERNAAIKIFTTWAEHFPVTVIYGNHDRQNDLDFLGKLRSRHQITVLDRPKLLTINNLAVACLPWPKKAHLVSKLDAGQDVSQVAIQAMRAILNGFAVDFQKTELPRVLLAHAELGIAVTDNGQPLTGRADIELNDGDLLDTGADVVCLGHIHQHQVIQNKIVYAGSPRQCVFGENNKKGHCIIDVQRGKLPVIEHRKAPGRELITVDAEWEDNALSTEAGLLDKLEAVQKGTIVRLKYHVPDGDRGQAAEQAERAKQRWLEAGAHSVTLDQRIEATYRVRSEAIREARTNEDRLDAWWGSIGQRPDREKQIKEKLGEIEAEA
jgi:exonuclease SbcD